MQLWHAVILVRTIAVVVVVAVVGHDVKILLWYLESDEFLPRNEATEMSQYSYCEISTKMQLVLAP
jgi:hypothetical protein